MRSVSVLVANRRPSGGCRLADGARGWARGERSASSSKYQQRVVVKARVVRNRGAGGRGTLEDHLRYVERDGVDEEGGKGQAFGADDTLTPSEVEAFAERGAEDRHHFRFIVSPEHGSEIDLPTYREAGRRRWEPTWARSSIGWRLPTTIRITRTSTSSCAGLMIAGRTW